MSEAVMDEVQAYWTHNLHDMAVARHSTGTREFFDELSEYHFDKQRHLARILDYASYRGTEVLDLGCGLGIDALRFAQAGALVTGVDISERAIELAKCNFELHGATGRFLVMDGKRLEFEDNAFDAVYAHGILPYTDDCSRMTREIYRVLKPGGKAILQTYNRRSWLYFLWKRMNVELEHQNAPHFRIHSIEDMKAMTLPFSNTEIITERFPVKTRLHKGWKGVLYNGIFVKLFNALPRRITRPYGWHIVATVVK